MDQKQDIRLTGHKKRHIAEEFLQAGHRTEVVRPKSGLTPIPFFRVVVKDDFWGPRIEANQKKTIPLIIQECQNGRIDNFVNAAKSGQARHEGVFYDDSDLYKLIEGVAYCLRNKPDAGLIKLIDDIVDKIISAQWDDGYINTYYSLPAKRPEERWTNLKDKHELYCAGHLIEAAIAYYEATGKPRLIQAAIKFADYIYSVFGPDRRHDVPGHQEIEIALIKLCHITGERKYLNLAKFFLDQRGNKRSRQLYGTYCQDHKLVIEQDEAVGHTVRAGYMYAAMADIAAHTNDIDYRIALDRLWRNVVSKKIHITGGVGVKPGIEGYGEDYELPNLTAYCEVCAAIANVFWSHRMFLLSRESKYIDMLERILYNGFLAAVSLDGEAFFYVNPLESDGEFEFNKGDTIRKPWFNCACCPTNIVRFVQTIPGYIFAQLENRIFVNLFASCRTDIEVAGRNVRLEMETNYPWDGRIRINVGVDQDTNFQLRLRIPGWSRGRPVESDLYRYLGSDDQKISIKVNGRNAGHKNENGYAVIDRFWADGDCVEMILPMPVRRVLSHEKVVTNRGKVALERGPLVYCAEWPDNELEIDQIVLSDDTPLKAEHRPDMLGGVTAIFGKVARYSSDKSTEKAPDVRKFTAIPYYAWAHRGKGKMAVWLNRNGSL